MTLGIVENSSILEILIIVDYLELRSRPAKDIIFLQICSHKKVRVLPLTKKEMSLKKKERKKEMSFKVTYLLLKYLFFSQAKCE